MYTPEFSSGRSPRRPELQGPRPTPLKVSKESHKIRKPPVAPQRAAAQHHHHPHAPPPPRPPVIIYTVSPKIIHADPNEFMSLVQRLTGPNSSSLATSSSYSPTTAATSSYSAFGFQESGGGAISPAARFASIEKTRSPDGRRAQVIFDQNYDVGFVDRIENATEVQRTGQFPGILSPNPNALPPLIPPNFFSLPSDNNINNPLSFFHDLSPVLHSNRNLMSLENNFNILPSPSNNFFSPHINTPSPNTLDLFHSLFDI